MGDPLNQQDNLHPEPVQIPIHNVRIPVFETQNRGLPHVHRIITGVE